METATFYPRRKAWSSDEEGLKRSGSLPKPVIVTRGALEGLMPLSLSQAALKVGLSPTTFKKACRQVGICKWPYRPDYEKRRRATTAHRSQQDGADACHAWPSSPRSELSATSSSHDHASAHRTGPSSKPWKEPSVSIHSNSPGVYTPLPHIVFPLEEDCVKAVAPSSTHAWSPPPSSQPRIAAPSHYTTSPSIVFTPVSGTPHELRPSVEAVLEYLEDFELVGGHLASLMGLVDE